jgi:hypothetical protein
MRLEFKGRTAGATRGLWRGSSCKVRICTPLSPTSFIHAATFPLQERSSSRCLARCGCSSICVSIAMHRADYSSISVCHGRLLMQPRRLLPNRWHRILCRPAGTTCMWAGTCFLRLDLGGRKNTHDQGSGLACNATDCADLHAP